MQLARAAVLGGLVHLQLPLPAPLVSRAGSVRMNASPERPQAVSAATAWQTLRKPEAAIGTGLALLLLLVGNRLFTEELLNSQSRADLLATIAPVVLLLDALTALDITPREADAVPLAGRQVSWVSPALPEDARRELLWMADAVVESTPCIALGVWSNQETLMLRGLFAADLAPGGSDVSLARAIQPGPLLRKCVANPSAAPEYLPALQLLPGRIEYSYLPEDTQAVLMLPLGGQSGALILAADRARAFKEDDIAWARTLAFRLGRTLAALGN